MKSKLFLFYFLMLCSSSISSQGLNPQDLFDTGINMGYLEVHSTQGTAQGTWPVWASNATAEWSSAWGGVATPITLRPSYPWGSFVARNSMMQYMITNASGYCTSPWFQISIVTYEAGYYMGRAFAQTNYSCPGCVQSELFTYALKLDAMGSQGIPGGNTLKNLARDARSLAGSLRGNFSEMELRSLMADLAEDINSDIANVNNVLPNELMPCNDVSTGLPFDSDMSDWKVDYGKFSAGPTQVDATPPGDGKTSYYVAPDHILGNWTRYRILTFEKKSWGGRYYGPDKYAAYGDIILYNGTKSARFDIEADHSREWKTFSIPLNDSSLWQIKGASSLTEILRNVTAAKIRAEYGSGTDYSSLRRVMIN